MKAKNVVYQLLARSKIPSLVQNLRDPGLSILMFHGQSDQPLPAGQNLCDLHQQVAIFAKLCSVLEARYHVISLSDALAFLRAGETLPPKSVVLTFDDGYASNYHLAFPLLQQHGLPATIFVSTSFVENCAWLWHDRVEYAVCQSKVPCLDISLTGTTLRYDLATLEQRCLCALDLGEQLKRLPQETLPAALQQLEHQLDTSLEAASQVPEIYRPLDWNQLRLMQASGLITVGGHTHRHLILSRCQPETIHAELEQSNRLIAQALGAPPQLFAYPNGKIGDSNELTHQALLEAGYSGACTTESGHILSPQLAPPFTLRRFAQPSNLAHMEVLLSGVIPFFTGLATRTKSQAAC